MRDLTKIYNPYGDKYPDNNDNKEVFFQACGFEPVGDGDRHILIRWLNGEDNDTRRYTQIIQLSGGPGNYAFHHPSIRAESQNSLKANTFYSLGILTRVQRDEIICLAFAVKFKKTSRVNTCHAWTRDLLEAMVGANLISQSKFDEICQDVPLKKRVPEHAD